MPKKGKMQFRLCDPMLAYKKACMIKGCTSKKVFYILGRNGKKYICKQHFNEMEINEEAELV